METAATNFFIDVFLTLEDLVGAALVAAEVEASSELVLELVEVALVPGTVVEVPPAVVTVEATVDSENVDVLRAEGDAVETSVDITPGTLKGAVSDRIAVGTELEISRECWK